MAWCFSLLQMQTKLRISNPAAFLKGYKLTAHGSPYNNQME